MAKNRPNKSLVYEMKTKTEQVRKAFYFFYNQKFFNKWMNKFDFKELNYQQKHYIMKKYWADGTIACSSVKSANKSLAGLMDSGAIEMGELSLIFTPWTNCGIFNIYDFPTKARLINKRGVSFITQNPLEIDVEVVIGYCQKNHKSVFSSIEAKLNELVDVEMKKRLSRKSQSQPWMFVFTPEDYNMVKKMQQNIEYDEPYNFVASDNVDRVKALTSGAPYITDKLEQDRQKIENDILTILGCNNVGVAEKKEHLVVDEINANNQDIMESSDSYATEIKDWLDRIKTAFNFTITLIENTSSPMMEEDEEEDNEDEMDE